MPVIEFFGFLLKVQTELVETYLFAKSSNLKVFSTTCSSVPKKSEKVCLKFTLFYSLLHSILAFDFLVFLFIITTSRVIFIVFIFFRFNWKKNEYNQLIIAVKKNLVKIWKKRWYSELDKSKPTQRNCSLYLLLRDKV